MALSTQTKGTLRLGPLPTRASEWQRTAVWLHLLWARQSLSLELSSSPPSVAAACRQPRVRGAEQPPLVHPPRRITTASSSGHSSAPGFEEAPRGQEPVPPDTLSCLSLGPAVPHPQNIFFNTK